MKKLNKMTVVGLCIFSFCFMSAGAEESSTFGFQSQEIEDDDPITIAQQRMNREELSNKVIQNLYQKNVLNKQKYEKVERDRLTLFVVEKMLRDPTTSPEERVKLEAQWRELKKNEGKHLKEYNRYTMERGKILQKEAEERSRKINEKVKRLREEAAKKAEKEKYGYIDNENEINQEDFFALKTGKLASRYKEQINDLTGKIASEQLNNSSKYYEEEEEEEVPYGRIFSEQDYKASAQRATATANRPMYADTVSQAQNMFAGKDGLLIPNSPLGLSPEKREEIRQKVELFIKQHNLTKIRADERETLNALLFNYGIQVLETGEVIALEVIEDYTNGERMVAPDIPVPSSAQQVYVGPEDLINEVTTEENR